MVAKACINVAEDVLIETVDYTSGNAHDSNCFTGLLSGKETAAYADSAYRSQDHDQWLSERKIENRIIKSA